MRATCSMHRSASNSFLVDFWCIHCAVDALECNTHSASASVAAAKMIRSHLIICFTCVVRCPYNIYARQLAQVGTSIVHGVWSMQNWKMSVCTMNGGNFSHFDRYNEIAIAPEIYECITHWQQINQQRKWLHLFMVCRVDQFWGVRWNRVLWRLIWTVSVCVCACECLSKWPMSEMRQCPGKVEWNNLNTSRSCGRFGIQSIDRTRRERKKLQN